MSFTGRTDAQTDCPRHRAYSSYSENGFALKDAVRRLHQLSGLFTAHFGTPGRVYLVGHSLGAAAALVLAETYPSQYDGVLPMCGLVGGTLAEVSYLGDARVLFDYYFPGVLPGDVITVPEGVIFIPGQPMFDAVFNALIAGLFAPDQRTLAFAVAARLPFSNVSELIQSAMTVIGFNLRFTNDLLERTQGHPFFDNTSTIYPQPANDGVARFVASPDAANYLAHYFTPTGQLARPTVTLHTRRDPAIPLFHETRYAGVVQESGGTPWLVQRTVDRFGHCAFTQTEVLSAFDGLVQWVTTGLPPAGGEATAP